MEADQSYVLYAWVVTFVRPNGLADVICYAELAAQLRNAQDFRRWTWEKARMTIIPAVEMEATTLFLLDKRGVDINN